MKTIKVLSLVIAAALLLASCGIRRTGEGKTNDVETKEQTAAASEAAVEETEGAESESEIIKKPENAAPAGLYNMTSSDASETYELVSTFKDDMSKGRDLCVLGGFPSRETTLTGADMGEIWNACVRDNSLSDTLRPGYLLEFDTPEGKCEKLILRPSDVTEDHWEYIETYIYDDIHQTPGAWYSHLLDNEFTDDTIVTSVKITAGEKIGKVENLKLTIFMYDVSERSSVDVEYAKANGYTAEIIPNTGR